MHWFAKLTEKYSWKTHRYLGLGLLVLVWIFVLSGLLLDHSGWPISRFWPSREVTKIERQIDPPAAPDKIAAANNVMEQLGISGELDNVRELGGGDSLRFNVNRPGNPASVSVNLHTGLARLEFNRTNLVGLAAMLHTFTGIRSFQPESTRDWSLTKVWSFLMDLLSVGMILIVAGGLVISFRRADKLALRVAVFGAGVLVCLFFLFGLQWIY